MMSVFTVTHLRASFLTQASGGKEAVLQAVLTNEQRFRHHLPAPPGPLVRDTLEGWH